MTTAQGWTPPQDSNTGSSTLKKRVRRVVQPVLVAIRRGGDPVLWTPPKLGGGNHLYMWLWAWQQQRKGIRARVLLQPGMELWTDMFPALRELSIERASVPFRAPRPVVWAQDYAEFGVDTIDSFVREVLVSSQMFSERIAKARMGARGDLTINARRGDYYTNPKFTHRYAMDFRHLMALLSTKFTDLGLEFHSATLVSDDPQWILRETAQVFPQIHALTHERVDMFDDLAQLAIAPALALSNSTFSYWGGYLNDALHDHASFIFAPTFHAYREGWPRAWQLAPHWIKLDNFGYEIRRR